MFLIGQNMAAFTQVDLKPESHLRLHFIAKGTNHRRLVILPTLSPFVTFGQPSFLACQANI